MPVAGMISGPPQVKDNRAASPGNRPVPGRRIGCWIFLAMAVLLPLFFWWMLVQPVTADPPVKCPAAVEPAVLERHVRYLAEDCFPRDAGHPANLNRAARYIQQALTEAGGRTAMQPLDGTFQNVTAYFGPSAGEQLVVGAHYDACGEKPGADDNASAVACLLELARLLGKRPPACPVELVAYTLEEPPYWNTPKMGSAVHANRLREKNRAVRAMLCLEMTGYFSDEPGSQHYPSPILGLFYPAAGNFIAVIGRWDEAILVRRVKAAMQGASPLPVYSMNAPESVTAITLSDHKNYWAAGYPAVMITDTAFMRNRYYHTSGDTPDRLDYSRMAEVVKGVYAALQRLAE